MKRIALSVFLVLVAGQAQTAEKIQTGFITGSTLLEYCSVLESQPDGLACFGYVMGISDLHDDIVASGVLTRMYCMPSGETGVRVGQLVLVVEKYLHEHPEELHTAASALVMTAFAEAFPCKSKDQ